MLGSGLHPRCQGHTRTRTRCKGYREHEYSPQSWYNSNADTVFALSAVPTWSRRSASRVRALWWHRQGCIKNITWDGVDADGYCLSVWIDAPSRVDACVCLIEFPGVFACVCDNCCDCLYGSVGLYVDTCSHGFTHLKLQAASRMGRAREVGQGALPVVALPGDTLSGSRGQLSLRGRSKVCPTHVCRGIAGVQRAPGGI